MNLTAGPPYFILSGVCGSYMDGANDYDMYDISQPKGCIGLGLP